MCASFSSNPARGPGLVQDSGDLCRAVFRRAYRCQRRWDEGLWRWAELGAVATLLSSRPPLREGPILDVGCGDGEAFETVFGIRPDAFGVDPCLTYADDVARARLAGRYVDVRKEDAARMSFETERFQLVFSNSVLEHIAGVEQVIAEVFRVLCRGGHFLFTTPAPTLYSKDAYAWRHDLAPLGLDRIGRWMAERECVVYHHVSVLGPDAWKDMLLRRGFDEVLVHTYMPKAAARAMSRYGGASRVPILGHLGTRISKEARALAGDLGESEWIERCRTVLGPLLRDDGSPGCGQLVLARKP